MSGYIEYRYNAVLDNGFSTHVIAISAGVAREKLEKRFNRKVDQVVRARGWYPYKRQ